MLAAATATILLGTVAGVLGLTSSSFELQQFLGIVCLGASVALLAMALAVWIGRRTVAPFSWQRWAKDLTGLVGAVALLPFALVVVAFVIVFGLAPALVLLPIGVFWSKKDAGPAYFQPQWLRQPSV